MVISHICALLAQGGSSLPYAGLIGGGITLAVTVLFYVVRLLPIAAEVIPVVGAFVGGVEFKKHTLIFLGIFYLVISISISTGKLSFCGA